MNLHDGTYDADQYVNTGGRKGALLSSSRNDANNLMVYSENAFYFLPKVAFVAGVQYLNAQRTDGQVPGRRGSIRSQRVQAWSPKIGLLWEVDRTWQVYGNISRSAEVPSFGENSFASASAFDAELGTATTYELGTRGRRPTTLGPGRLPHGHRA